MCASWGLRRTYFLPFSENWHLFPALGLFPLLVGWSYPDVSATSEAYNTFIMPRPEPSCEPFEPHRDQVRRDRINPFTWPANRVEHKPIAVLSVPNAETYT